MGIKRLLFIIAFILSTVSVSFADESTGKDFLELADNYKVFAEFDKAMKYCDKSIATFNAMAKKTSTTRQFLSKAHYLKANLLNYTQAGDERIEAELFKAITTDPNYTPPKNYTNHPDIIKILKRSKDKYEEYINTTFNKALDFYMEQKYCLAEEMLAPIVQRHKNPEYAESILAQSKTKCLEKTGSVRGGPTPKKIITPKDIIGILPVAFEGNFTQDTIRKFKEYLTPEKIKRSLRKFHVWTETLDISERFLDQTDVSFNIDNTKNFILSPADLSASSVVKGIFRGKLKSKAADELDPHLQSKLAHVFDKIGCKYLFLCKITDDKSEGIFKQNVTFNLYRYGKFSSPIVVADWGLIGPMQVVIHLDDMSRIVKKRLDEI